MRKFIARSLVAVLALSGTTIGYAQSDTEDQEAFSQLIAKYFVCSSLVPIGTQTIDSSNRFGAVGTYNQDYLAPPARSGQSYRGEILTLNRSKPWCTPDDKYPLPTEDRYGTLGDLPERQHVVESGASFTLEITKYFKALDISISNVKAVSMAASNVSYYEIPPVRQNLIVDALLAQNEVCQPALKTKTSRMIVRVCRGDVVLGVYFKNAISGSILNIALGQISANFSLNYLKEDDSVAPCEVPKTAAPAKPTQGSDGKPAQAPAAPAKPDSKSGSKPAVAGTDTTKKVSISFSAEITGSGTPAAAKATDPAKSDPAAKAEPDKCYRYAKLAAPKNGIFGINLTPVGSGPDSVVGMAVTRQKLKAKK